MEAKKDIELQRNRLKVRVVNREVEGIKGVVAGIARNLVIIDSIFVEGVTSTDRKEVEKFVRKEFINKGQLDKQINNWRKIGLASGQIASSTTKKKEEPKKEAATV